MSIQSDPAKGRPRAAPTNRRQERRAKTEAPRTAGRGGVGWIIVVSVVAAALAGLALFPRPEPRGWAFWLTLGGTVMVLAISLGLVVGLYCLIRRPRDRIERAVTKAILDGLDSSYLNPDSGIWRLYG